METNFIDLPVLKDNDKCYFSVLEGVINSIDPLSTLEVRKNLNNYSFRIAVTNSDVLPTLIKDINALHNMIGIKVDFSKSIKKSFSVSFKINLD